MTNEKKYQRSARPHRLRGWAVGLTSLGASIVIVGAFVNLESKQIAILADLLLVALGGAVLMHFGRGSLRAWVPWIAAGALSGAALMTVLQVAPWPVAAALAFVVAGFLGAGAGPPRWPGRIGLVAVSAAANATLLWTLLFSPHRPAPPDEYYSLDLRMHELLADVPLHDVWVAHLRGGPRGMTMQDLRWLLVDGFRQNLNTSFVAVAGLRELLGSVFRWDDHLCRHPEASVVHRLTEDDRDRSLTEPGAGLFVYVFENEALIEIRNCTVHALIGIALAPVEQGYDLYWSFYVERVAWITPFYMALIQPFRRTVVYPPMIDGIERGWAERWSSSQPDPESAQRD